MGIDEPYERCTYPWSKRAVIPSSIAKTVTLTSCAPLPQMYLLTNSTIVPEQTFINSRLRVWDASAGMRLLWQQELLTKSTLFPAELSSLFVCFRGRDAESKEPVF